MPLVFISYDCTDSDVAVHLAAFLKKSGFSTWIYEEDSLPGPSYLEQISQNIRDSDVVIIVISRESLQSRHVKKELFRAYELGKGLLPILRDVTHAEFTLVSPDMHQALVTNVAITLPASGLEAIGRRILAGIETMIQSRLEFTEVAPKPGPSEVISSAPVNDDEWSQLKSRLAKFPAEIEQLRQALQRSWRALAQRGSATHNWKALASERVNLADSVVREVLEYVISQVDFTPANYSVVARGGYGRGFLSEGSDVDISLVFAGDLPREAEGFWKSFQETLTDVWSVVPCIRVAPLATTIFSCAREWHHAVSTGEVPLESYVSFAFSRCIAGSNDIHEQLRHEWRAIAREADFNTVATIVRKLRPRLQLPVTSATHTFNLKSDAGGVLDFRLTSFVEQFLSCRGTHLYLDDVQLVRAHEFFLVLRDQLHRLNRTPLLARDDLPKLKATIENETGEAMSSDLWAQVVRYRRTVHVGLRTALDALERSVK